MHFTLELNIRRLNRALVCDIFVNIIVLSNETLLSNLERTLSSTITTR